MGEWLYALACVVAPAAWAVLMVYVLGRKRPPPAPGAGPPPVDYSI